MKYDFGFMLWKYLYCRYGKKYEEKNGSYVVFYFKVYILLIYKILL